MKRFGGVITVVVFLFTIVGLSLYYSEEVQSSPAAVETDETKPCVACHTPMNPSIVASWKQSSHAEKGVGCYECHKAAPEDADAIQHFGENPIAVIVSPKDCGACHATAMEEFLGSHHAKGGEILDSLDNYLGEVVEGFPANVSGCQQCHGSKVIVGENGDLDPTTWPNFGIGRINPDGTSGACSSCHTRHGFSSAQARAPENCGKCHLGPDHPQKEVYEESKHYIAYRAYEDDMNMDSDSWVVGVDYTAAPTCASCHVSATRNQSASHDIGLRSQQRRPAGSFNLDEAKSLVQEVNGEAHGDGREYEADKFG